MENCTATFGSSRRSTTKSSSPLASVRVATAGATKRRSAPSAGDGGAIGLGGGRPRRALGPEAQRQPLVGRQVTLDRNADVGGAGVAPAREIPGEAAGIAEVGVVLVQQIGLAAEAADALEAGDVLRLLLGLGAIELGLGRAGRREPGELLVDQLLELGDVDAGARGGDDDEGVGDLAAELERR